MRKYACGAAIALPAMCALSIETEAVENYLGFRFSALDHLLAERLELIQFAVLDGEVGNKCANRVFQCPGNEYSRVVVTLPYI